MTKQITVQKRTTLMYHLCSKSEGTRQTAVLVMNMRKTKKKEKIMVGGLGLIVTKNLNGNKVRIVTKIVK